MQEFVGQDEPECRRPQEQFFLDYDPALSNETRRMHGGPKTRLARQQPPAIGRQLRLERKKNGATGNGREPHDSFANEFAPLASDARVETYLHLPLQRMKR